jgi:hypothetical protein
MRKNLLYILLFIVSCSGEFRYSIIETKKEKYKGVIIYKYIDSTNHCARSGVFRQLNVNKNIVFELWPGSWDYAKISDSIIKNPDTLMIIIKKNDSIKKNFKYVFDLH